MAQNCEGSETSRHRWSRRRAHRDRPFPILMKMAARSLVYSVSTGLLQITSNKVHAKQPSDKAGRSSFVSLSFEDDFRGSVSRNPVQFISRAFKEEQHLVLNQLVRAAMHISTPCAATAVTAAGRKARRGRWCVLLGQMM